MDPNTVSAKTISTFDIAQYQPPTAFRVNPIKFFDHPDGSMHLEWVHRPSSALLVEKIHDPIARNYLIEAVQFLNFDKTFTIYVEKYVAESLPHFTFLQKFTNSKEKMVDFVLVFGGDGTLLHVSSLFPEACPPILPFALGSLGFLTPFLASDYRMVIDDLIRGFFFVTSRTRIMCTIIRKDKTVDSYQALNDVVIGPSVPGQVCAIECYIDDEHFTTVYGDGLIVSTSTGSTAYNLSAGGAMVHPSVSTLLWTPICAHSLNAHPLVLPDCVGLSFKIAEHARGEKPYLATTDSKRTEIYKGDLVVVNQSPFPIPTVCQHEPITDWLSSISTVLRWNQPMQVSIESERG